MLNIIMFGSDSVTMLVTFRCAVNKTKFVTKFVQRISVRCQNLTEKSHSAPSELIKFLQESRS